MGKRIVLCFDGTWNSPESETNVYKLFTALGPPTAEQVGFYYTGVGAEGSALERVIEGATGEGILEKIRQGYDDLAKIYEPGDQIFLFGFSRGAYAARCLANMVASFGLPTRYWKSEDPGTSEYTKELGDVIFGEYRNRAYRDDLPLQLRDHCLAKASVEMVGVWDTVGSLGLTAAFGKVNPIRYGWLDPGWHPNILHSYQALAIDERRPSFAPLRWTDGPGPNDPEHGMEQVWFPGVHSDVGGGYKGSQQAECALGWMMIKARRLGLEFDRKLEFDYTLQTPDEFGKVHESWRAFWGPPKPREVPAGAALSSYVSLMKALEDSYQPKNLVFNDAAQVAPNGTDLRNLHRRRGPGDWVPFKPTKAITPATARRN
jgi:uncharacterized protein (DUF2235 family)